MGILPFKAALFQSAIDAKAPIQAVTLRYYDGEGQRTDLPSYAEVNLFQSLWRIVSMRKIRIRLDFSPQYKPTDMPDKDRYALKDIAETAIGEIVASILLFSPYLKIISVRYLFYFRRPSFRRTAVFDLIELIV